MVKYGVKTNAKPYRKNNILEVKLDASLIVHYYIQTELR